MAARMGGATVVACSDCSTAGRSDAGRSDAGQSDAGRSDAGWSDGGCDRFSSGVSGVLSS
ncbi:hypothetical protein [Paractinoplanes brasiliensis]|uniref:hypothetical protein n=1 Tax=Paractinoplanes brasiliensis TaxID=52695 RepID=UPI00105EBA7A|nr:hypothetical protein [Actinoplanes brasiliensis]